VVVVIRKFDVVWAPIGSWERKGPKMYVVLDVKQPVKVKAEVSGYFLDGLPYEVVEEDTILEQGTYARYEGPFSFTYKKPFDPIFGHEVELRLETDKGTFTRKARFYMLIERVSQIAIPATIVAGAGYATYKWFVSR